MKKYYVSATSEQFYMIDEENKYHVFVAIPSDCSFNTIASISAYSDTSKESDLERSLLNKGFVPCSEAMFNLAYSNALKALNDL